MFHVRRASQHLLWFVLGLLIHFRCLIKMNVNDSEGPGDDAAVMPTLPSVRADCHRRCTLRQHARQCHTA